MGILDTETASLRTASRTKKSEAIVLERYFLEWLKFTPPDAMRKCCMIIGARCPWRCHLPRSDFQQVTGPSEYVTKHETEHHETCDRAADANGSAWCRASEWQYV